ncbi:MAG: 6-bladed beta-propeller [Gallionella sp.]
MKSHRFSWIVVALIMTISGCAETRLVMNFTNSIDGAEPKLWPAPPDKPRYSYVGELTGENNFSPENWANRSTATKVFDWLVGLSGHTSKPVVLQRPQSGMVDASGRIYVTDIGNGGVYVFDNVAGKFEVWKQSGKDERFVAPIGIAQGKNGEILVVDAELHTVIRLDHNGIPVGELGRSVLKRPTGLARDAARGLIFVADTYAHDIKVFGDDGILQKVIGQRGDGDAQLNFPTHLTFESGKLYVTDTMNSRVLVFDEDGNMLTKFGRRGLFVGDMVRPKGVAVDSGGNIYVVESMHDRLLIFNSEGRTLLAIGGSGPNVGEFYLPAGVWIDSYDRIYIADMFNGRITVLQLIGSLQ